MPKNYDFFISSGSADKDSVESLVNELTKRKLTVWYDRHELRPGEPWQVAVEKALQESKALLVFIGPSGIGPWANRELAFGLDRQVTDDDFLVIPVLGPGARTADIPAFLRNLTFVDLRSSDPAAFARLESAVKVRPALHEEHKGSASPKVFLCHAKEDGARVEGLYYAFRDEGLDPWYDKKKLVVGDRWENEIIRAIEQTDFFSICLSERSVKKIGFIQRELKTAVREYQKRPQDIAYLLPIRLEECALPRIDLDTNTVLSDLQWHDLFEGDSDAIAALARGIWAQWNKRIARV